MNILLSEHSQVNRIHILAAELSTFLTRAHCGCIRCWFVSGNNKSLKGLVHDFSWKFSSFIIPVLFSRRFNFCFFLTFVMLNKNLNVGSQSTSKILRSELLVLLTELEPSHVLGYKLIYCKEINLSYTKWLQANIKKLFYCVHNNFFNIKMEHLSL